MYIYLGFFSFCLWSMTYDMGQIELSPGWWKKNFLVWGKIWLLVDYCNENKKKYSITKKKNHKRYDQQGLFFTNLCV